MSRGRPGTRQQREDLVLQVDCYDKSGEIIRILAKAAGDQWRNMPITPMQLDESEYRFGKG